MHRAMDNIDIEQYKSKLYKMRSNVTTLPKQLSDATISMVRSGRGEIRRMPTEIDDDCSRERTLTSLSPVISRKDSQQFTIPKSYAGSPVLGIRSSKGAQYRSLPGNLLAQKSKSLENFSSLVRIATIGSVNLEIWYSCEDEMLLVRLHRIDILAKPSPSVINSWDYTPEVRVSILQEKRKFWDSRASKGRWTLTPHQATYIPIKKSVVQDQCLRLTCFDGERKNDLIPIGHVFVQLKDLDLSWKSSCYVREIEVNSVPGGFSTGRIDMKFLWISSSEKLEIRIGKAGRLKSPHGTLRRYFYAKLLVFTGGEEIKHWKSQPHLATPDVKFDETYHINLNSSQLSDSTFVVQVFARPMEKFSFNSELIGTAIIGPYMPKALDGCYTQWEKIIISPFEEISETQNLYL